MNEFKLTPMELHEIDMAEKALARISNRAKQEGYNPHYVFNAYDNLRNCKIYASQQPSLDNPDLYTPPPDMSNWTVDELLEQKRAWADAGVEVIRKAHVIAKELGVSRPKKHGANVIFDHNSLLINYDDYSGYVTLHYQDKRVGKIDLRERNRTDGIDFVPGAWVHIIDEFYPKALEKQIQREIDRAEKRRQQLLSEMGQG